MKDEFLAHKLDKVGITLVEPPTIMIDDTDKQPEKAEEVVYISDSMRPQVGYVTKAVRQDLAKLRKKWQIK